MVTKKKGQKRPDVTEPVLTDEELKAVAQGDVAAASENPPKRA
jgi:hypothetical protein